MLRKTINKQTLIAQRDQYRKLAETCGRRKNILKRWLGVPAYLYYVVGSGKVVRHLLGGSKRQVARPGIFIGLVGEAPIDLHEQHRPAGRQFYQAAERSLFP